MSGIDRFVCHWKWDGTKFPKIDESKMVIGRRFIFCSGVGNGKIFIEMKDLI
jgi:hypothetical protein|tara:strand:- start:2478 stop:2633 length:156 start_codon:yes stop_codon:yes gene_type:complete